MASISITSTSFDSIRARLVDLDTNWANGTRECYWYISTGGYADPDSDPYDEYCELDDGDEQSPRVTFSGLDMDTKYYIVCDVWRTDTYRRITTFKKTATTDTIELWDWEETSARQKAYDAITSRGKLTDFSYTVWNEMVDKVLDLKDVTGKSWYTTNENTGATYLTSSKTKMTSSDKLMTADRFNSLKFQIGNAVGTGLNDVSPGDKILGEYFILLADKINAWIEKII